MYFHRGGRQGRTVSPNDGKGFPIGTHRDSTPLAHFPFQVFHHAVAVHHAVYTYLRPGRVTQHLAQPFGYRGRARHFFFHQLIFRSRQLGFRGQEVTGVSPQSGLVQRHHGNARRPVKAGYPFPPLPVIGHVFTVMGVCAGEDVGAQAFSAQELPQLGQPFLYLVFHIDLLVRVDKDNHFKNKSQIKNKINAPVSQLFRNFASQSERDGHVRFETDYHRILIH